MLTLLSHISKQDAKSEDKSPSPILTTHAVCARAFHGMGHIKMIPMIEGHNILRKIYENRINKKICHEYAGAILDQEQNGHCLIVAGKIRALPIPGLTYIFVTMSDGSIRIDVRNGHGHAFLAQCSEVCYAGEITFKKDNIDKDKIVIDQWSNFSDTYQPPATLAHQARLDTKYFMHHSFESLTLDQLSPMSTTTTSPVMMPSRGNELQKEVMINSHLESRKGSPKTVHFKNSLPPISIFSSVVDSKDATSNDLSTGSTMRLSQSSSPLSVRMENS